MVHIQMKRITSSTMICLRGMSQSALETLIQQGFHDLSNVIYAPDIAFNLKVKKYYIQKESIVFCNLKSRGGNFNQSVYLRI